MLRLCEFYRLPFCFRRNNGLLSAETSEVRYEEPICTYFSIAMSYSHTIHANVFLNAQIPLLMTGRQLQIALTLECTTRCIMPKMQQSIVPMR